MNYWSRMKIDGDNFFKPLPFFVKGELNKRTVFKPLPFYEGKLTKRVVFKPLPYL